MGGNMILETERLYLRELNQADFHSLCRILQDEDTMYAYEGAFSDHEVQEWLDRQISRYQKWNFGLWTVILKETDGMIGQCGLTMQPWKGEEVCSIIRNTNTASQNVAIRNGMAKLDTWTKHYQGVDMPHDRYVIRRGKNICPSV
jgi:RimJ/RimL family protein N-acetyltransferase